MLQNTTLIVLSIIGIAVAVLYNNTTEKFLPSRQWKVEKVMSMPSDNNSGNYFFQTPNFQSMLSPRFSNVNYGPNLRTKFPNYNQMGVPEDPLNYENMDTKPTTGCVRNNISSPGMYNTVHTPNVRAFRTNANYGAPVNPRIGQLNTTNVNNYQQMAEGLSNCHGGPVPTDTVVTGDTPFLTPDGEMKNPIIYDRYIFANRSSRLRSQGDPIRGDLPIVPQSGNWFTPSVHPNIDLQAGALNVLGGINNDTSNELANLIYNSSGRSDTAIGGVNMSTFNKSTFGNTNMSNQTTSYLSAGQGDVNVVGYP